MIARGDSHPRKPIHRSGAEMSRPVKPADSSDARKTASAAGTAGSTASSASFAQTLNLGKLIASVLARREDTVLESGVDQSGCNRIHSDAGVPKLFCNRLNEAHDRGFRRSIGGEARKRCGGTSPGKGDDASATSCDHVRYCGMAQMQEAIQIYLNRTLPFLEVCFPEVTDRAKDACGVNQHIDPAVSVKRGSHNSLSIETVRHISLDCAGVNAESLRIGYDVLHLRSRTCRQNKTCSLLGQRSRHLGTNPPTCTCHDARPIPQLHAISPSATAPRPISAWRRLAQGGGGRCRRPDHVRAMVDDDKPRPAHASGLGHRLRCEARGAASRVCLSWASQSQEPNV